MKVLELFSGTRSIGRAFEARGHEVFSVDYDRKFLANAHCDIETLTAAQVLEWFGRPDVIWASWTNHPNPRFKPPCSNGDPCHEGAPRGAKTGTQGIKGARDRSRIPAELCNHIAMISEE